MKRKNYEGAIGRKTGASVRKLRKEQKAAEQQEASIDALSKAKSVYAERGDVNSCGDWLALALKEAFRTDDGSFDLTAFKACLKENSLEAPKFDMGAPRRHRSLPHVRWFDAPQSRKEKRIRGDRRQENRGTRREKTIRTRGGLVDLAEAHKNFKDSK